MPNVALIDGAETVISALVDVVDGYPSGVHKLETATAGNPVEFPKGDPRGGVRQVTDHAVARQARLVLEGWVSDFDGGNRPREAWEEIRRLHKSVTILTVLTEWGVYPEMLIRRAEAPQDARGMRFTLELEEVIRVGVTDVDLPASNITGPAAGRSGEITRGRVQMGPVETL